MSRRAGDRSASGPGVPVPPPLVYVAGFLLGLGVEAVVPLPGLPTVAAVAAGAAGALIWLALDARSMLLFSRARTPLPPNRPASALVTSGPYRVTRNPMYVGMAALYAGLALALGVIWALAFLPAVLLAVDRLVVAREERHLEEAFGDEYRAYRRRVRRWL